MSSGKRSNALERLEVPSVDPLERRLNVLNPGPGPPSRPIITSVPKSALLSRLQQFMPQMEAANQQLHQEMQSRPAEEFDVENVPEHQEGGYIEMDLACGVLDLKDDLAIKAAEAALAGERPDLLAGLGQGDSGSSDDSSSCTSSDDEDDGCGVAAREGSSRDDDVDMDGPACSSEGQQNVAQLPGRVAGAQSTPARGLGAHMPAERVAGRRVVKARRTGSSAGKARPKIEEL